MTTTNNENTDNMVLVDKEYLNQLEEDQRWLFCLEAAGVDRWNGYDSALELFEEGGGD